MTQWKAGDIVSTERFRRAIIDRVSANGLLYIKGPGERWDILAPQCQDEVKMIAPRNDEPEAR